MNDSQHLVTSRPTRLADGLELESALVHCVANLRPGRKFPPLGPPLPRL